MTNAQYLKAIELGKLPLTKLQQLKHFSACWYCFILASLLLIFYLKNFLTEESGKRLGGEEWIIMIPIIAGILFYILQKKRLVFKIIESKTDRTVLTNALSEAGQNANWKNMYYDNKVFTAKTSTSLMSVWGEQITVLFSDGRVFINCICDLDKRPTLISYGQNQENEYLVIKTIKEIDQNVDTMI